MVSSPLVPEGRLECPGGGENMISTGGGEMISTGGGENIDDIIILLWFVLLLCRRVIE